MLHDEARQLSSMRVTDGIRTDGFKRVQLRLGAGLGGLVAATCEPYATADYSADSRLSDRSTTSSAARASSPSWGCRCAAAPR
jgi:signal transduction protein with GAF and PtsI domain